MGIHKNLHASTKTKYQVKSGLLLDVVVGQSASVLKLLSCKDKTLLVWGNTFLILNLSFHVVDSVRWFDIQSDGLSRQGLHKNLHASTKTKYQVKSGLLLDVVVGQSASVLKLLSCKDKTLLVWGNTLLILNLSFHVVDSV